MNRMSGARASFTPFTNKVRMPRLGQEDSEIAQLRSKIQATAMREDVRALFLEKLTKCAAMTTALEIPDRIKCLADIREALGNPLLPMLTTREEIERRDAEFERKITLRMEPAAWVSLAAVGAGVGWLVYKS